MMAWNNLPPAGFWLVRGSLTGILLLAVAGGTACRQAPNLLLLGSTNNVRVTDVQASARWATPMQVPGVPNLYQVSDNLYRGAQPTAEGWAELQKRGIKTVVNLRESNSDQDKLAALGVDYEHIPMSAFFVKEDDVVRFLQIAGNPAHTPVFVHCQRGADRTGLMCAVYRIAIQGWTKDEALTEMTQGGFRFNRGLQNIVHYIQDLNIDQLKRRAGLAPQLSLSAN